MYLSHDDYIKILKYYKIKNIEKLSRTQVRKYAENLLAEKLCRCIKKITKTTNLSEQEVIPICKNSVIKQKKLKINRFSCKKKPKLIANKKSRKVLQKL